MPQTNKDHWERQDALLSKIERPFADKVRAEKNRYLKACIPVILRYRRVPWPETEQHRKNMRAIFKVYYSRAIKAFNSDTEEMLKTAVKSAYWEFLLSFWYETWGASKAMQTANTTRQDIQDVLFEALNSTESVAEDVLIQNLLGIMGINAWRAETIARTETHQAAMFASKETAKRISADTGLQIKKKWVPVQDKRTRDWHAAMENHPAIGMAQKFDVGGERMDRPGDPEGSARNVCNCRCALVYESDFTF